MQVDSLYQPSNENGIFVGAGFGSVMHSLIKGHPRLMPSKGALIGALAVPSIMYALSRSGAYDKGALAGARELIEETK